MLYPPLKCNGMGFLRKERKETKEKIYITTEWSKCNHFTYNEELEKLTYFPL